MQELFIKDLHVRLSGKEILKGIHLDIQKGEFISLLGAVWSGKIPHDQHHRRAITTRSGRDFYPWAERSSPCP